MVSAGNLAASVGGILELHYAHPALGPIYSIRLAVTLFDPAPSGALNDYLYTGAGGFTPGESGILDTFAHLAALWAPYYDPAWAVQLAGVHLNVGGTTTPLPLVPTAAPVAGAAALPVAGAARAKRAIWLLSSFGARWRVWLRQLFPEGVGESVPTSASTGGLDARDRAWFGYVSGGGCAVVGRDGAPFRGAGLVRAWWDTPPAPYVVSG